MKISRGLFIATALALLTPSCSGSAPNMAPDITEKNITSEVEIASRRGEEIVCKKRGKVDIFSPDKLTKGSSDFYRVINFTNSWNSACFRSPHGSKGARATLAR